MLLRVGFVLVVSLFSMAMCASSFFSPTDASLLRHALDNQQDGADAQFLTASPSPAQATARALFIQKALSVAPRKSPCAFLNGILGASKDLLDLSSAAIGVSLLGSDCKPSSISAAGISTLKNSAESTTLGDLAHVVSAASVNAQVEKELGVSTLSKIASNIVALQTSNGLFKGSTKEQDSAASGLNTGRAWLLLAKLKKLKADNTDLKSLASTVSKVFSSKGAVSTSETLHFEDSTSNTAATAAILSGVEALAEELKRPDLITDEQTAKLAEFFARNKHARGIHTAFHVITGLKALSAGSSLRTPLVLEIVPEVGFNLENASEKAIITATDILGAPATDVKKVHIISISQGDKQLAKDVAVTEAGPGRFEFDFLAAVKGKGISAFTITASASAGKSSQFIPVSSAEFVVKMVSAAKLTEVFAAVSDTGVLSEASRTLTASFPNKIKEVVKVDTFQHLHIGFGVKLTSGKTFRPEQAVARFQQLGGKKSVQLVVGPNAKKDGFLLEMNIDKLSHLFNRESGTYKVSLLVGDQLLASAIQYQLGEVNLTFNPSDNIEEDNEENSFSPKKEIIHQFRPVVTRPISIVPLFFSGVVAAALLGFVYVLLFKVKIHLHFARRKTTAANSLFMLNALFFQAAIAIILLLFVVFWIGLDIFSTLFLLSPVALLALFTGRRALSDLETPSS